MSLDNEQPIETTTTRGKIVQFLRRNQFLVQLRAGQVVAFMPEKLLPIGRQFTEGQDIRVTLRLRKSPKMPIIIEAHPVIWCA